MKNFDTVLRQQHAGIQKTLTEVSLKWTKQDIIACALALGELSFLLAEHHNAEFSVLFSKIWNSPKLKEGGPFCTYFYNFMLNDRPLARVTRIINQVRSAVTQVSTIEIPENLRPVFEQHSMAGIPLEEHLAIRSLVEEMKAIIQNWDEKNASWFAMALGELHDLVQKNIEKEETCLWALVQNIA
ncbi:MAG: hypothetical protein JNL11_04985 [Bdellovibrionaceae bacterium]|nr:hypothetical protein [Pseudobdellovibrionaceae bacterium]